MPAHAAARLALLTALLLLAAGGALADCYYNGVLYPEETRVGAFVCRNGQWVEG